VTDAVYDLVHEIVVDCFELDGFVFEPTTDIISEASRRDPEIVEWILDAVDRRFSMTWPQIEDSKGRLRRAVLTVQTSLTVRELADIVHAGAWPTEWTRQGQVLNRFWEMMRGN
jgi:hypothetical protein